MKFLRSLILLLPLFCVPRSADAQMVRPTNLEDLVANADRIVVGTIRSSTLEPKKYRKSFSATVVTVDILETIKGTPADQTTFRQVAGFENVPRFFAGERVVLFLLAPTPGFSSPYALGQGVFRFVGKSDDLNSALVMNGAGNRFLAQDLKMDKSRLAFSRLGLTAAPTKAGPLKLSDLKDLIAVCR